MWFIIAVSGYLCLAVVTILDKYILSEQKMRPILFVFYSTVFLVPLWLLVPFGVKPFLLPLQWVLAFVAGLCFALTLWALYHAVAESEASHIGPFIGAVVPSFVLVFSRTFLFEQVTVRQGAAIALLIVGSLIISFENSPRHHGWHRGFWWGIVAGFFAAVFQVLSKYLYGVVGFYSGFVWIWSSVGLCGVLLLAHPVVREALWRQKRPQGARRPITARIAVLADKLLGAVGVVLVQYAVSLGSVAVVNALAGVQFGFLVILIAVLSKFTPGVFREKYVRGEIIQEIAAVALIAFGLGLVLV
ncbi:MAG: DMT family transporter [Candidatus Magasanikbacteria bacterium]|nr:DMT family transporter [Candidatus Magasanikbacteria bacterium]